MKRFAIAVSPAIALLIAACAPQAAAVAPAPAAQSSAPANTTDPVACKAKGGAMAKVCRRQTERCVTPYKDAGKRCSDKSDCQGLCLYEGGEPKPGAPITGVCQKSDDPCGCFQPVEKGKLSDRARCVD